MRNACLLLLACSLPACTHAEAAEAEHKRTDFKRELSSQYKFTPSPVEEPKLETSPALIKPVPKPLNLSDQEADPDVVQMPAYTVTETIRNNNLHAAIMKGRAMAQAKKVKFGTGLHEYRGRKVTLYAVTVFYVPVAVGISW